jgi:uncharacterized protein YkwD
LCAHHQKPRFSGLFAFPDWIETAGAAQKIGEFFLIIRLARLKLRQSSLARWLAVSIAILLAVGCPLTAQAANPAELISSFRLKHGEGKVATDAALNRIAQEQAKAMAARDVLDHDALRPFSARVTQLGSVRSAENIAYGYDTFPKTLDQWIGSSGHRYNLLMHGASRIGIASAKSQKSGRTYWAMVIAAPEPKSTKRGKGGKTEPCRIMLNDTCLK